MKKFTDIKKSKAPKAGAPIWAIKWPVPKEGYRKITKESVLDKVTLSPESIAKKHGVTLEHIQTQLEQGIKIEQEHTSHLDIAREIALDHLGEDPDYYTKLKKVEESRRIGTGSLKFNKIANNAPVTYNSFGKIVKPVKEEVKPHDLVTIHYGAHAKEPHRVTRIHPDGEATITPSKARGRANRYPQGELKVSQKDLHPFAYQIHELHDEPDRPGVGIGLSGREGMNVTEEPRKTLKLSKADWDHHTRHSTAQYDHEGKPWIVQKDPSGAAIRIPVHITEDYPYRKTLRAVLKEAFPPKPEDNTGTEKPVSKTAKMVKDTVKKDKAEKSSSNDSVTIGKTKDTFEPDPVLTPVLSVANMPGGAVR